MTKWNQLLTSLTKIALRSGTGLRRTDAFISFDSSGAPLSGSVAQNTSSQGLVGFARRAIDTFGSQPLYEAVAIESSEAMLDEKEKEAKLLCAAMLAGAFGFRIVNDRERLGLLEELTQLGISGELLGWVSSQIDAPTAPDLFASYARSPQLANDIYACFLLGVGPAASAESPRLDTLATALALTREQVQAWHQSLGL